jgi:rare lipoprotein A
MASAPMGLVQPGLHQSGLHQSDPSHSSPHHSDQPLSGWSRLLWFALSLLLAITLSACSSAPRAAQVSKPASSASSKPEAASTVRGRGGYYMDDGPMDASGINLDAIADAVPAVEPLHRFANRPYNVFGTDYTPQQSIEDAFEQSGVGSWYGRKFHGQKTSSGEIYDMFAMTAAHPTLPIPSYARVSNPANGRSVIVRVNDRGPFLHSRVIDLSYAAAYRLGYVNQGSAPVRVEKLTPVLIAQLKDGKANSVALDAPSDASGFFLQLGAFSVEDNARALLSRMSLEFSEHLPNLQVVRREPHFRLLAGPYRSREEAQQASRRLKDLTSIVAVVLAP